MNILTHNVVAIDGREASGKGETSKNVAKRLGYIKLDSGAFYRTVTLLVMQAGLSPGDVIAINRLVDEQIRRLTVVSGELYLDGKLVGDEIRTREVSILVPLISPIQHVRKKLIPLQRACACDPGLVAEGRDMGSVVFPDARLKIFLTAPVEVRAQRRLNDYRSKGNNDVTLETVLEDIRRRDRLDETRRDSPLVQTPDAEVVDTGALSPQEVEEVIVRLWRAVS